MLFRSTGNKVKFTYAVITELREKLSTGATADVLVLPTPVLDSLAKDGKVRADSRATALSVSARGLKQGKSGAVVIFCFVRARSHDLCLLELGDGYYARSWFLDHVNNDGFNGRGWWLHPLFFFPRSFLRARAFGLGPGDRPLCSSLWLLGRFACLTACSRPSSANFCPLFRLQAWP